MKYVDNACLYQIKHIYSKHAKLQATTPLTFSHSFCPPATRLLLVSVPVTFLAKLTNTK